MLGVGLIDELDEVGVTPEDVLVDARDARRQQLAAGLGYPVDAALHVLDEAGVLEVGRRPQGVVGLPGHTALDSIRLVLVAQVEMVGHGVLHLPARPRLAVGQGAQDRVEHLVVLGDRHVTGFHRGGLISRIHSTPTPRPAHVAIRTFDPILAEAGSHL